MPRTLDIEKRVRQHNSAKSGARYTKLRRPVILVRSEEYPALKEARAREAELKSLRREKKMALIPDVAVRDRLGVIVN